MKCVEKKQEKLLLLKHWDVFKRCPRDKEGEQPTAAALQAWVLNWASIAAAVQGKYTDSYFSTDYKPLAYGIS